MKPVSSDNRVTIYLIADRPLDKRFWSYWVFDLLNEIKSQFVVLQLTYIHDFLKEIKESIPKDDGRIQVLKFFDENSAMRFLNETTDKQSLVFFYTWAPPNAYMNVFRLVDKNFGRYYYLMHGVGDNACDHIVIPKKWDKLKILYKKIRFVIGMMRRFKGPRYWLDSTKMRINAQYPYLGPFGYRTKLIVTGNHFQERYLQATNSERLKSISRDRKSVLWLDQNLPNVNQFGYKIEVDAGKYYTGLSKIFAHLNDLGYDVYLTLHPDTQKKDKDILMNQYLKNSAKILEVSSEIACLDADLILAHDSTASYFGVLADKPMVNLIYRHLKDKPMIDSILGLSRMLNTPMISYDESDFEVIDFVNVKVNQSKYNKFKRDFILGDQEGSPHEFMKSLIKKEIESMI
ncbi:hypothetical protein [Leptospira meyeri]|uniref:hypothetical protein n=1 Tax=Leptospira meyeri TaxID=29508 RepID=UPI0010837897|nr:hypothetical protein [Leptospira meyeri]TGL10766.1 hypothetical protein EHQ50_17705 [Leptospira meyeri]